MHLYPFAVAEAADFEEPAFAPSNMAALTLWQHKRLSVPKQTDTAECIICRWNQQHHRVILSSACLKHLHLPARGNQQNPLDLLKYLSEAHLGNEQVPGADKAQHVHDANVGEDSLPFWRSIHKVVEQIRIAGHQADWIYQGLQENASAVAFDSASWHDEDSLQ